MKYNIKSIFCINHIIRVLEIQVVPLRKTVSYPFAAASRIACDACWGYFDNSCDDTNANGKYKKENGQINPELLIHLMWGETKVLNVLRIKAHYRFLTFSCLFFIAILSTFSIKQETVIGPTPPGTGVI